jgi:Flp pilus assembly protein TadG
VTLRDRHRHRHRVPADVRSDDRGFVTVWTVALAFACVSLVGLVHDAGRALRAQSDAFGSAAAAARAGAQEVDRVAAVTGTTRLDENLAHQAAASYLAERGLDGTVTVAGMDVTVTVMHTTDLQILPGSISVDATATAHAAQGPTPP